MHRFSRLAIRLLVWAFLAGCAAEAEAGVYVKFAGLYNRPSDLEVANAAAFKASLKNNTGFAAAMGFKFSLLRLEAELQHLRAGAEDGASATGPVKVSGALKETTGFANLLVDLPGIFGLGPYLGAGLGYARVDLSNLGVTRANVPVAQFSGADSVFGYQGMGGLQWRIFGTLTINAGYRIVVREKIAVRDVAANARERLSLGRNRIFELGLALGF